MAQQDLAHGGVPEATPASSHSMAEEGRARAVRANEFIFSHGGYPLIVFFASIVLTISAVSICSDVGFCKNEFGFAVAAGVISIVVSGGYLWLERKGNLDSQQRLGITAFLFVWWAAVAGVTTFSAPFIVPGNGYFAAWGGLFASLSMLMSEVARVREAVDRFTKVGHSLGILLVGSLVVLFAGVGKCNGNCGGGVAYAIAVGAVSFAAAVARVGLNSQFDDQNAKYFSFFMVFWWIVAFIVLTFIEPFEAVGNGYFGTWACLLASLLLFNH